MDTNRLARVVAEHAARRKPLIDLTVSNPTTAGFIYPEQQLLTALADRRSLQYSPESKGMLQARQAVADYYRGQVGFDGSREPVDPERVLLTSGTSEAYSYIFRLLCDPGDQVLIPTPSYPLFEFLADLGDIRLIPYPLLYDHGWQIDFSALREALTPQSRAVLVVHPNNPTGSFVKPHEATELGAVCAERQMAIVADEVFLDYRDASSLTAATFALNSNIASAGPLTFTLSGVSKVAALPQMKLAWLVVSGPENLARPAAERLEVIADTYLSPGAPAQLALPTFLALAPGMQTQLQPRIAANLACLDRVLRAPCAVTRLQREGGWYAILRVPVSQPGETLAVELVERCSVLVHPGSFYNFASEGFLVLSLITPEAYFEQGLRRLVQFVGR